MGCTSGPSELWEAVLFMKAALQTGLRTAQESANIVTLHNQRPGSAMGQQLALALTTFVTKIWYLS